MGGVEIFSDFGVTERDGIGVLPTRPFVPFPSPAALLTDSTSATDVLGYYVTESLRGQVARYSCGIPFSVGYDIEAGDIVSIHPRWESAAVKCRVVQVVFSFDSAEVNIVLESVT